MTAGDFHVGQLFSNRDVGRNSRQWDAGGFGNEGEGSRTTWVDFQHVEFVSTDAELDVEATTNIQSDSNCFGPFVNLGKYFLTHILCGDEAGRITTVNSGLFQMLHHRADEDIFAITDSIDIQFDGTA